MKLIKILIICLTFSIMSCSTEPPKFHKGEIVKSVIGNHVGQVIYIRHDFGLLYHVRFDSNQSFTNTHLLSSDDAINTGPISLIKNMREFELKKYNEDK